MDTVLLCHECGFSTKSNFSLKNHRRHVHDKRKMVCKDCTKEVEGLQNLKNHIKSHKFVDCDVCQMKVAQNSRTAHKLKCAGATN